MGNFGRKLNDYCYPDAMLLFFFTFEHKDETRNMGGRGIKIYEITLVVLFLQKIRYYMFIIRNTTKLGRSRLIVFVSYIYDDLLTGKNFALVCACINGT